DVVPLLVEGVGLAAVNGPGAVVVSGVGEGVGLVEEAARGLGWRVKRLRVSHAFHSPLMDGMLEAFRAELAGMVFRAPRMPLVSAVSGRLVAGDEVASAEYWVAHARATVRFADAVAALEAEGVSTVVEVGPDAVLAPLVAACASHPDAMTAVPLLRSDRAEPLAFLSALAQAYVRGVPVDWAAVFAGTGARRVDLPTYAFQHQRYWLDSLQGGARGLGGAVAGRYSQATVREGGHEEEAAAPDDLRHRFARLDDAGRRSLVQELVDGELDVVLGYAAEGRDPDRGFAALGINSLTASELRSRINALTGLRLPPTAVFDHPTPAALSQHVGEQWALAVAGTPLVEAPEPAPATSATTASTAAAPVSHLRAIFQQACAASRAEEGIDVLAAAARLRERGLGTVEQALAREPVRFSEGAGEVQLICVPSLVAPATAYQYAKFAEGFRGVRNLSVVVPSGYEEKEFLPETLDSAVDLHAEAVSRAAGDRPFALVGYSSGGWLAHAVAHSLELRGKSPSGVVLLDTYLPGDREIAKLQTALYRELATKQELVEMVDDANLAAMGHYLRLFDGWAPQEIHAPTLLLSASKFSGFDAELSPAPGRGADWPLPHTMTVVPGTHVSMIDEFSGESAEAVAAWLSALS
ncbi:acyltransferase domain-containing protein, partial [Streptomyces sp. NPDC059788]|uniref:acyltransferase domain-containing protein n=1 Tax=Streptomyces sp. NPDC059788 TaxID=3346948 RepID=UPI00364B6016